MTLELYTVGHSTHSMDRLLELLKRHSIQAVYDVRSWPYSRYNPQFNRQTFRSSLEKAGIRYVFLGDQLGARSKNPAHHHNGKVQYSTIAESPEFKQGLGLVLKGIEIERAALLCAEKDPINCHRAVLICRHIRNSGVMIQHILEDGTLEPTAEFETRLLRTLGLPEQHLFATREETIERAYELQSEGIAYPTQTDESQSPTATGSNVITLGDGNLVNAQFTELHSALTNLKAEISKSDNLSEAQKLNLSVDIESIKDQLAKERPNKTIIGHLWSGVEKVITGAGLVDLILKVTPLIANLIPK